MYHIDLSRKDLEKQLDYNQSQYQQYRFVDTFYSIINLLKKVFKV